ncbi:MAG: RHS repeat domain-containing protein, partial [Bacteroidota bacterium]
MDYTKLPNVWYDSATSMFTNLYEYNHLSAKVLPTKKTIKDYSVGSGQAIVTEEETFYDNPTHTNPTRVEITDSEGGKQKRVMRYPLDYAPSVAFPNGNGLSIQDLIDRHMIGIPLETQSWKVNAGGQEELLAMQVTRMKDYANASAVANKVIQPHAYLLMETVDPLTTATFSEPTDGSGRYTQLGGIGASLVRRLSYDFTPSGTMKAKIPEGGTRISYVWDEGENQLLGQVVDASEDQVAYSSFESPQNGSVTGTDITPDGGWEIVRTVAAGWVGADPTKIQTGRYGFHLANRGTGSNERYVRKTGIPPGDYIVSFWHKGDPVSIIGSTHQSTPSNPGSEMQYVEFNVSIGSGGTLEVSSALNAFIDELRLYPVGAQMTTYSYDDKLRLHSQTDVNNRSTYYHYDAFGRLQYVQDQEGHFVQGYEYNYKN